MVEIFGRESVGKTALSLLTAVEAQKDNGHVCFINLESNITKETWLN
jgi:RecA/RadA recombinase